MGHWCTVQLVGRSVGLCCAQSTQHMRNYDGLTHGLTRTNNTINSTSSTIVNLEH